MVRPASRWSGLFPHRAAHDDGYFCYFDLEPRLIHVQCADDIRRAKREGRLGIIFGCQGIATKLDGDPSMILIMAKLGQRIMDSMYNEKSALGCGALETEDTGLTEFGRVCIREIDDCRMVVDLAHAGARTARDAILFGASTPIITHGNVRSLTNHQRNAPDDVLKALAERGGVIGITAYAPFCEKPGKGRPGLDDMIDHIVYVAEKFGVDHVGIGSDFFEGESWVRFERSAAAILRSSASTISIPSTPTASVSSTTSHPCPPR